MPISLGCGECGRLLRIKDELTGKRIKCPHCNCIQLVPQRDVLPEDALPPAAQPAAAEFPKEVLARSRKTPKVLLLVGIGVAVLLCGFGLWYVVLSGSSGALEQFIPGQWGLEAEATRSANPGKKVGLRDGDSSLDIRARGADYSMIRRYPNVGLGSIWKVVSRSGETLTLESYAERNGEQLSITPLSANQLRVVSNRTDPPVMVYKRK